LLFEHLQKQTQRYPNNLAVVYGDERLSYRELYNSVLALAGQLRASGVNKGDFVCLLLPNSIDFVVSFFAVAAVQGVAIPLDPALTIQERSRYLNGLTLAAIVSNSHLKTQIPSDYPLVLADTVIESQELPIMQYCDGPVLCQFSSGSTGLPKRIVRTQQQLIQEHRQLAAALTLRQDDVVAVVVPMHHAHGFGNALLLAICNGLCLVIPKPSMNGSRDYELPLRFWRKELLTLLASERVTILPAVPFVYGLLAEASNLPKGLCLRLCISAGSPLTKETYQRFRERFGVPIRQLYGCTEAGSVTLNTCEDIDQSWQSVGVPLPGVELRLESEEGLVAFRSGAMADGYHGQQASDSNAFHDGWFRPGDLGHFDDEGRLYIRGRHRSFIDSGGYKVDPVEVEQILCTHPQVAEAIVFGVPHPALGEMIKAVVVPHAGITIDKQALNDFCSTQLAVYKRPRLLDVKDSLPRSPLGKVLVRKLI
jgi:long-chain acyl-CoA synthetase